LVDFDTFIQNELEKVARESREKAVDAYKSIKDADLSIGFDQETQNELKEKYADLVQKCTAFEAALKARQAAVVLAAKPEGDWLAIGDEPNDPAPALADLNKSLVETADAMEKASDEKGRIDAQSEFNELDARIQLRDLKTEILRAIEGHVVVQNLNKCLPPVRTHAITSKSTEINEQVISKELADALTAEYKKLGVGSLKVTLKSTSQKGKTYYKLVLQAANGKKLSDILSEGEQRAVAIGSFLAEVNIGRTPGGVIFDDPMSSLDHRRREKVAERLVEEARKRQVIIFTHDLYFLCMLQQEAQRQDVGLATRSLHKTTEGFGVASENLPFDGTQTKARIGRLRVLQTECEKLHRDGDEQAYLPKARETYRQLRIAWERAVEEVLLHGTITRFSEGVSTLKLREVIVEDDDYFTIEEGMSRCSKYAAHDGAAMANVATPEPDELKADIETLETWRAMVEKRKDAIRNRRKKA
jgi:ABC-type dipeptide/oligopeptide/nickel transport system ATPase subunit